MRLPPDPVRRLAARCAVLLLVAGVGWVEVLLCSQFRTAVTPVPLALLGAALLGPLCRRPVRVGGNPSPAAGLTCVAVVAVVGGARAPGGPADRRRLRSRARTARASGPGRRPGGAPVR